MMGRNIAVVKIEDKWICPFLPQRDIPAYTNARKQWIDKNEEHCRRTPWLILNWIELLATFVGKHHSCLYLQITLKNHIFCFFFHSFSLKTLSGWLTTKRENIWHRNDNKMCDNGSVIEKSENWPIVQCACVWRVKMKSNISKFASD